MSLEICNPKHDSESLVMKMRELSEFNENSERTDNKEVIKPDIKYIETTSMTALFEQNRAAEINSFAKSEAKTEAVENKHTGLTEDEKVKVKEAHPDWPDELIDAVGSWKEYEIYSRSNLKVEYINGKPCLIRTDIDIEQTDAKGRTNRERMEQGLAPLDKNGRPIELHHIGQRADSPLAELSFEEHHCDGNDSTLHDKNKETEVHGEGNNWQEERENHWETRSL